MVLKVWEPWPEQQLQVWVEPGLDLEAMKRLQRVWGPDLERWLCVARSGLLVWSGRLDEHFLFSLKQQESAETLQLLQDIRRLTPT